MQLQLIFRISVNKWKKIYTKQIMQLDSKNTAIIITIELVMNNNYREFPKKRINSDGRYNFLL